MDQKQDTDLGSSTEDGSITENTSFTRNKLLKAAGAAGAGIAFGAVTGSARAWTPSSRNAHLSKNRLERGMVGGPTGFDGAQRYQYGPNTAAGRAIAGLKKITNNGKKQLNLNMRMWSGATGQLSVAFPKGAPTVADQLLKEAGVRLRLTADRPDRSDHQEPADDLDARRVEPHPRHVDRGQRRLRRGWARPQPGRLRCQAPARLGPGLRRRQGRRSDSEPVRGQLLRRLAGRRLPGLGLPAATSSTTRRIRRTSRRSTATTSASRRPGRSTPTSRRSSPARPRSSTGRSTSRTPTGATRTG